VDQHFGELLEWLNQRGEHPPFRVMKVLDRGAYDNFFDLGGHCCR
jgi:lantibiotic modifying enzyme